LHSHRRPSFAASGNRESRRWDALDVLRGLTIMLMLLNLAPGSWSHNFSFLVHAQWEGWTLIDMVAPAFLFCIGAAMPLSFERRLARGDRRADLARHVVWRGVLLVAIGFFLNLYPQFDVDTVRVPGVLQRIGLCYVLCALFVLATAERTGDGSRAVNASAVVAAAATILVSYWALLYFVPVPGYGAPRFDPEWNWAAVIDRTLIGVQHLYPHWPVNGKIVFDPEGLLSTVPACVNVLLGTLAGVYSMRSGARLARSALVFVVAGCLCMLLAYAAEGFCPIVKNIWTSTFALLSGGFALTLLGLLMTVTQAPRARPAFAPARIFGENPLLAYVLVFLIAPLIDARMFGDAPNQGSLRSAGQAWLEQWFSAPLASLLFGLAGLALIFMILLFCHHKRLILRL
jgi:predicted acyltransferase